MLGKIFISYSKQTPEPTKQLATFLESQGYAVWWDIKIESGKRFRDAINQGLEGSDAVIVIWTPASIKSDWVVAEAEYGDRLNRLITLRTSDVEPHLIPMPFSIRHADLVTNRDAILATLTNVLNK